MVREDARDGVPALLVETVLQRVACGVAAAAGAAHDALQALVVLLTLVVVLIIGAIFIITNRLKAGANAASTQSASAAG